MEFIGLLWICEVADSLSCLCGLWVCGVYAFKVLWCCGVVVFWFFGCVVLWCFGDVDHGR